MEHIYLFFFFTVISLASQVYEDIKTLNVDSRRNFYMYGVVITLALLSGLSWDYLAALIIVIIFTVALRYTEKKENKKLFGGGDTEILNWIVPGTVILGTGLLYPIVYLISFAFSLAGTTLIIKNYKLEKFPGTIPIAMAFFITLGAYVTFNGITL